MILYHRYDYGILPLECTPNPNVQLGRNVDENVQILLAWPFLKPVSEADVPDYYNVIKRPDGWVNQSWSSRGDLADFSTMEDKLEGNKYPTFNDFVEDAMLVFSNSKTYNNEHSIYARNATKMEKFLREWVATERSRNGSISY